MIPANCVTVGEDPLGKLEVYLPGGSATECDDELASGGDGFGPDSQYSELYVAHDLPTGTPACAIGIAHVFPCGLSARTLASQISSSAPANACDSGCAVGS